jgi:hypothetical protein
MQSQVDDKLGQWGDEPTSNKIHEANAAVKNLKFR